MGFYLMKIKRKLSFQKCFYICLQLWIGKRILQWKKHVHLHPVDVSYDDLKAINNDGEMNAALLDNKDLRKNVV